MKQTLPDRSDFIRNFVVVGDFVLLILTMILTWCLEKDYIASAEEIPLKTYLVISCLCYVPCIYTFRVTLHQRIVRPEQIVGRIFSVVGMHIILFSAALSATELMDNLPAGYFVSFYLFFLFSLIVWRLGLRVFVKRIRKRGMNARTVVLVGGGENIAELHHVMNDLTYGYRVKERFCRGDADTGYFSSEEYKSELRRLYEWLAEHPVQELYCSLPSVCRKDVLEVIHYCENNMIRFYSVPNIRNYVKRQLLLTSFGGVPVLSINQEPLRIPMNRFIKRSFDLCCSSLFLLTVFPVIYIVVGIIIKLTSPGPVFFKQLRTGEDGRDFTCYKFRSMRVNKDSDKIQATKNDARKTKFGDFLRKSNLDEVPQFINVFLGDMSLVGPRPHMLKHTEEYSQLVDKYMMRHWVKPGITGWAQVTGYRGETKEVEQMEGRVKRDLWYIENWTFLLDLRILVKTVSNMFHGEKNAY